MIVVEMPIGGAHADADALVSFEVNDGAIVVSEGDGSGVELTAKGSRRKVRLQEKVQESLADSLGRTLPALSVVLAELEKAAPGYDEITVEMGLRVGGTTGLVFVQGNADANVHVTVTRRRGPAATGDGDGDRDAGDGSG